MHPILLTISNYELKAYVFFTWLALIVVFLGIYFFGKKYNFEKKQLIFSLIIMSLASFLGARFLHILTNISLYKNHSWRLIDFSLVGFSIYGGIIGAVLAAIICAKVFKFNFWKLGDISAPFLALGIVIMRIGCFLNGCCFGKETNLPWGVEFPFFSYAHRYQLVKGVGNLFYALPVHPTQIYELIYAALGGLLSLFILRKKMSYGIAILVFGLWYTVFRLINYYFRVAASTFDASPYFYPIFYSLMIFLILFLLIKKLGFKLTKFSLR